MDAVVHLAGENISTGLSGPLAPLGIRPWTDAKKKEIMEVVDRRKNETWPR